MNGGLWLVMSGAYVTQELVAEFGQIPPSFLPVGNRRLYEYQFERIGPTRTIYLTLPETFRVPAQDDRRLAELSVTILPIPEGLSLGEAAVFALNLIGGQDQAVSMLHGDTLIEAMPTADLDWIGISAGSEGYSWAEVTLDGDRIVGVETVAAGVSREIAAPVVCGLFAFAHTTALVRGITRSRGSFIGGILDYARQHPLRALEVPVWYDFGHVQTYFRSRRLVTGTRHFNELRIDGKTARKTSRDNMKIRAEASWLADVPPPLRIYCARLIDAGEEKDGRAFYETEYGYLPTLAELFVFGMLGRPAWTRMLDSCHDFLESCPTCANEVSGDLLLRELTITKTAARLSRFANETGFDVDQMMRYDGQPLPSLMQIAEDIANHIDFDSKRPARVMHGDFCFSNILYDSRVQRIRVIDPRGYVDAERPSIYGDVRYDIAKLSHSTVGRYDQIIAGRYHLTSSANRFDLTFEQLPQHAWLEDAMGDFGVHGVDAGGGGKFARS